MTPDISAAPAVVPAALTPAETAKIAETQTRKRLRLIGGVLGASMIVAVLALSLPWYRASMPDKQVLLPSGASTTLRGFDTTVSARGLYAAAHETLPLPASASLPAPKPAEMFGQPSFEVLLVLAAVLGGAAILLASPAFAGGGVLVWFLAQRQLGALVRIQESGLAASTPSLHQAQYGQSLYKLCAYIVLGALLATCAQVFVLRSKAKATAAAEAEVRGEAPAPGLASRIGGGVLGGLLRLSEQTAQAQAQRAADQAKAQAARAAK